MKTGKPLAIVTGSSRGLGREIVLELLKSGMQVIGVSRNLPAEDPISMPSYHHECFDLNETSKIHSFAWQLVETYGVPDYLVLNGALGIGRPLGIMHETEISLLIRVNLEANILLIKYLSRHMLAAHKNGAIVIISSIAATDGFKNLAVYGATKAALDSMAISLAREFSGRGLRVMSVAPGFMETEMTQNYSPTELAQIARRTLNGTLVGTEAVAKTVSFLCSDSSSALNGVVLRANNGA
jgi:3-oxoacyl-[acyl-carrier protein] reductase